jgi:hypothetical protein
MAYKYLPCFRVRQQEIEVLKSFEFANSIIPIIEIIKEKDRKNNSEDGDVIYTELVTSIKSEKVLIDLPIYLHISVSTSEEVSKFVLSTVRDLDKRIAYYLNFSDQAQKAIPIISSLNPYSDEADTIQSQFKALSGTFRQLAFRLFINRFEESLAELAGLTLREGDIILYDLDTVEITSPLVKKHKRELDKYFPGKFKVVIRSAINTDIQNNHLDHGAIVPEANNSLLELYAAHMYRFDAFGDYVGVKKDEITSGGRISPGFIFFNPEDNLYYGFKGKTKSLDEFEKTIVPGVLNTEFVKNWIRTNSTFYNGNLGIARLERIYRGEEPGKNQAKFKWISMMHYLHSIKTLLA